MFNNELVDKMIETFGLQYVLLYCTMEATKNDILYQDCVSRNEHLDCIEYDYERDWWKAKREELVNQIKQTRYDWVRTVG